MFKITKKIQQLDVLVENLESESIDLDDAIDQYTKALKSAKEILLFLKNTETKITLLENEIEQIIII